MRFLSYLFDLIYFLYSVIKSTILEIKQGKKVVFKTIIMQLYFTGYEALPIVGVVAFAMGSVLISQSSTILTRFGLGGYLDKIMVQITIRELSPLILALIIIGRSGTAISAELGNMKLNKEIQALNIMGISLDYFIVFPRLLGATIALLFLSFYFNIIAVFGGFLILNLSSFSFTLWIQQALSNLVVGDIFISATKAGMFGLFISLITCFAGLSVKEAFTEIPQVATKGVVNSIVFCFLINVIIALFLFPTNFD